MKTRQHMVINLNCQNKNNLKKLVSLLSLKNEMSGRFLNIYANVLERSMNLKMISFVQDG